MDVSIIIRAKNEARAIGKVLEGVFSQQTDRSFEVVVVDSGSTDDTIRIATDLGCRIVEIKPEEFTWGHSLNVGADNSDAEYVVNLSAHSEPVDRHWLAYLLEPFSDENVGGVYGRQVPIRGVDPFEEIELEMGFPDNTVYMKYSGFSNASCALRRDLWKRFPFDEQLISCEDGDWATRVSDAGYRVVYQPSSVVYHSHEFAVTKVYRRWYWRSYALRMLVETDHGGSTLYLFFLLAKFSLLNARYFARNGYLRYLPMIPFYEAIRQIARWQGARDWLEVQIVDRRFDWTDAAIPGWLDHFGSWIHRYRGWMES